MSSVYLHFEGSFWKAYERSAYLLATRLKKNYTVLRKESKTLGRDILYVGFPQSVFEKITVGYIVVLHNEKLAEIKLTVPLSIIDFDSWRDSQEIEQASRVLLTAQSNSIESTPVYKNAYDILMQSILIAENVSKNCKIPFGVRLKELSYGLCYKIRRLYEVNGEQRLTLINESIAGYLEFEFLLQVLRDKKELSMNSFALLSEKSQSVCKQLQLLRRKGQKA